MTDYATASAAVSGSPVPKAGSWTCCVCGCPLPGTLSTDTTGATEWFCRLHFGARYGDYGQITAMARNRIELYRLAFRCLNAGPNLPIPQQLATALERHGRPEFLGASPALEGRTLTVRTLGRHMLSTLDAECLQRQKRLVERDDAPAPQRRDSWASVGYLVGEAA